LHVVGRTRASCRRKRSSHSQGGSYCAVDLTVPPRHDLPGPRIVGDSIASDAVTPVLRALPLGDRLHQCCHRYQDPPPPTCDRMTYRIEAFGGTAPHGSCFRFIEGKYSQKHLCSTGQAMNSYWEASSARLIYSHDDVQAAERLAAFCRLTGHAPAASRSSVYQRFPARHRTGPSGPRTALPRHTP